MFTESALNFPLAIHISARVWIRNLFHIDFDNRCVRTDSTSAYVGAGTQLNRVIVMFVITNYDNVRKTMKLQMITW